jgi:flagellin
MNSLAALSVNNGKVSASLEKLVTGKRINKAADDASGLAISQKMKAQIQGLTQAQRNIQDGISLIQTAESGLGKIVDNLLRLRELAIKSSNDDLTSEDREAVQDEVNQILAGIDDIAVNTKFNTTNLLGPQSQASSSAGEADIVFVIDSTGSMDSVISNVISNLDEFVSTIQSEGVNVRLGLVTYKDKNFDGPDYLQKTDFTSDESAFKATLTDISVGGGGDTPESGLEAIEDPILGATSFAYTPGASKQLIMVTDAPVHTQSGDGLSSYNIDDVISDLSSRGIVATIVSDPTGDPDAQLKPIADGTGGDFLNIYGSFTSELQTLATKIAASSGASLDNTETLHLQIGANSGETFPIRLFDCRAKSLGINEISMLTRVSSEQAIPKIDSAIQTISERQGLFGAYQNALEHVLRTVSTSQDNLTSSESRITDVDMAQEISKYTAAQISTQASVAMLVQANQQPNLILSLLKTE